MSDDLMNFPQDEDNNSKYEAEAKDDDRKSSKSHKEEGIFHED